MFDVRQEDGEGRLKTLHCNELLPFNSVPVGAIEEEQRVDVRGDLSHPGPQAPALTESESSSQSSSESSSESEDHGNDDGSTAQP